jgi:hypothetical protein
MYIFLDISYLVLGRFGEQIRNILKVLKCGVLENGDQLDRSCEKQRNMAKVKVERNVVQKIKRTKANWIGRILHRNCLLKHGRIEVVGRQGRRRKQLLGDLQNTRGYCKLKEEALDRNRWRTRFGRGNGPVF